MYNFLQFTEIYSDDDDAEDEFEHDVVLTWQCASLDDDDDHDDDDHDDDDDDGVEDDGDGDVVLTWQCASFEAPSLCHLH